MSHQHRLTPISRGALVLVMFLALVLALDSRPNLSDRMDSIRCEQWGGRFADPCPERH